MKVIPVRHRVELVDEQHRGPVRRGVGERRVDGSDHVAQVAAVGSEPRGGTGHVQRQLEALGEADGEAGLPGSGRSPDDHGLVRDGLPCSPRAPFLDRRGESHPPLLGLAQPVHPFKGRGVVRRDDGLPGGDHGGEPPDTGRGRGVAADGGADVEKRQPGERRQLPGPTTGDQRDDRPDRLVGGGAQVQAEVGGDGQGGGQVAGGGLRDAGHVGAVAEEAGDLLAAEVASILRPVAARTLEDLGERACGAEGVGDRRDHLGMGDLDHDGEAVADADRGLLPFGQRLHQHRGG
jgi:hypothetical protein